jgi:hypothetical protein
VCLILSKLSLSSLVNSLTGSRSVAVSSLASAAALVAAPLPLAVTARPRRPTQAVVADIPRATGLRPASFVVVFFDAARTALRSTEARIIMDDVLSRHPTRSSRARWIRPMDASELARTRTKRVSSTDSTESFAACASRARL